MNPRDLELPQVKAAAAAGQLFRWRDYLYPPDKLTREQMLVFKERRDWFRANYTETPAPGGIPLCKQVIPGNRVVELVGSGLAAEARWWNAGDPPPPVDDVVGCDTETHLIEYNGHNPPLVIGQFYYPKHRLVHIVEWHQMHAYIELQHQVNRHSRLLWQNFPFDFYVLGGKNSEWLFTALREDRIVDVGVRYLCNRIAGGHWNKETMPWNLAIILRNLCNVQLPKDPDVRLGFRRERPLTEAQFIYSALDPMANYLAFTHMENAGYPTEKLQVKAFVAMGGISRRGMYTDNVRFNAKNKELEDERRYAEEALSIFGLHAGVPGVKQVLQEWLVNIEARCGLEFPRSDKEYDVNGRYLGIKIKADKKLMTLFPDGDTHLLLTALKQYQHADKYLKGFVDPKFVQPHDNRIHTSFEPLVKTGRMSSRGPNRTNVPRDGGIRECSMAAPGKVLCARDYCQQELVCLAQDCFRRFGFSRMREKINEGQDLHEDMGERAAAVLGRLDMKKKLKRNSAKALNFGKPGGLSNKTWIEFAKLQYGVQDVTLEQAQKLHDAWLSMWPEMVEHLKGRVDPEHFDEKGRPMHTGDTLTGRVKPNSTYNSHLNIRFQGLAGDCSKTALLLLWLADFPTVNFIHDEFVDEFTIDEMLQDNIRRSAELQIKAMQDICVDVTVRIESALMLNWTKAAKPVCAADRQLLRLWTPDIHQPKEIEQLRKATDAEILSATPSGTRALWEIDSLHRTTLLGWQPLASVPDPRYL